MNSFDLKLNDILLESHLSRIYQHIENNVPFGIISPNTRDNTANENKQALVDLKNDVRKLGFGYIELKSQYSYEDNTIAHEDSLFIPKISRKHIMALGSKYKQESVLYKDDGNFAVIGTLEKNYGNILFQFKRSGKDNFEFSKEVLDFVFSSLKKGSQKGKKFAFKIQEQEQTNAFKMMAMVQKKQQLKWFTIYEE